MKVLMVGFQRSGTTILKRMLQNVPGVKHFFHELRVLKKHKTKEELAKWMKNKKGTDIDGVDWGEKVPFYGRKSKESIGYCKKWDNFFLPESRIIHIVRHPVCIGISTIEFRPGKLKLNPTLDMYCQHIPELVEYLDGLDHAIQIRYEDLMAEPLNMMKMLCEFCELSTDFDHMCSEDDQGRFIFGNQTIVKGRAFRYTTYPRLQDVEVDVGPTIKKINKIVGGTPYTFER